MYFIYSGKDKQFATAAVSKRDGTKTSIETIYLGKVIDREANIFYSKDRGFFSFDLESGEFIDVPVDFTPPQNIATKKRSICVDFGDTFFITEYMHSSGFIDIILKLGYGNPDRICSMIIFYIVSNLSNSNAIHWYEGNIVNLIYPKANLSSQRISEFLETIGSIENQLTFHRAYIDYIVDNYNSDENILIDSSGLPNFSNTSFTCTNVHNGKVNQECRLIFVAQKSTCIPLFYKLVPENIVDVSTLQTILLHLEELNIDINSCIIDDGYNSKDDLDFFYDDKHYPKINFVTRVKSTDSKFKTMIDNELESLEEKENFVKYKDRYLFIKKKLVKVGKKKNNPAWMYLCLDPIKNAKEHKALLKKAKKKKLSTEEVFEAMQSERLFGLLSNSEYEGDKILNIYYQRQTIEQVFDFSKNYTKLLPIREHSDKALQGHLLISYIAICLIKLMQIEMKEEIFFFASKLNCLRNQKCIIYENRIIIDPPQKIANDIYKRFKIKSPKSIKLNEGQLIYSHTQKKTPKRKTKIKK